MKPPLPPGWKMVKQGEVGKWGDGATPPQHNQKFYKGGTIPWLKTGDLNDGLVRLIRRVAHVYPTKGSQKNTCFIFSFLNVKHFVSLAVEVRNQIFQSRSSWIIPSLFPPLAEQNAIVAKVDEVFSVLDAMKTDK